MLENPQDHPAPRFNDPLGKLRGHSTVIPQLKFITETGYKATSAKVRRMGLSPEEAKYKFQGLSQWSQNALNSPQQETVTPP